MQANVMCDGMISSLFSTKEREKVLAYVLDNPSKAHRVRDVAKKLSVSVGSISGYFAFLKEQKILKRKGNDFYVNLDSPLTKTVKQMLNVVNLDVSPLKKIPACTGIGVYGSWAKGTNNENSDIDMWVRVERKPGEEVIAKVSRQMREKMERDVQILVIDPAKNKTLRETDPIFYYSMVYGSVVLYGKSLQD